MKRLLLYFLSVLFIVGGLFLLVQLYSSLRPQETGALQVSANVESSVYINDEYVGDTPFCRGDISSCQGEGGDMPVGNHDVKIVPDDSSLSEYTISAEVLPGVMTVVDRTFLPNGLSSAYILALKPADDSANAQLSVQSVPTNAIVSINGVSSGVTPFFDGDLPPSEHVLEIQKEGFAKKTIRVRSVEGYNLVVNVILGAEGEQAETDASDENEGEDEEETETRPQVQILPTPVGFLRVRSGPGTTYDEVTTVEPEDQYMLLSEENGWYEIEIDEETSGWVSGQYAEIAEEADSEEE